MSDSPTDDIAVDESRPAADGNIAESSPADKGGSMLDAVLSAIEPKDNEKSPSSAPDSETNTGAQSIDAPKGDKAGDPDADDLSESEIDRLHHKTKKQVQKLIGQRKDLESHVSMLRPKAEQYDTIVSHIRETGLDSADLDNLFEIGTLMKKGDLFAARDKLMPFVQAILEATGGVLPDDLEEARAAGQLSEQHARELAEMRSRNVLNQHQNGVRQLADAQNVSRQVIGGMVGAVNDWEQIKRRSDPDWGLKAPEIEAGLELAMRRGAQPRTVQEAVQMAENELAKVEAKLKRFRPQLKSVRPISGGSQASAVAGSPKSMRDAVMQSLG